MRYFASRFFVILLIYIFVKPCILNADEQHFTPLPPDLDGSMMPYDFRACTQVPVLPDSLTPVYVAYVARHGARYLSGPSKTQTILDYLTPHRNKGLLSETGEAFFGMIENIHKTNEGNWGDLSQLGMEEEKRLGSRMAEAFPELANANPEIYAISSPSPRVVMTMYAFNHRLAQINDSITATTIEGHQLEPLLCCFIADRKYAEFRKSGNWIPVYDDFVRHNVPDDPARRLFSSTNLSDDQLRRLTLDMYEVLKASRAYGFEPPTTRWMSVKEYHACWRADNLRHYLRNTITSLSNLAGVASAPLLRRIISDADKACSATRIFDSHTALNCYFGHCETLLPLLSLMQIPACLDMPYDFENIDDCWKIQDISPLAANLLILFATSPSGNIYVTLQLNGRTISPLRGEPDIIPWSTLRSAWLDRMDTLFR